MAGSFGWAFIGTGTLARKVIREITATGRHRVVSAYSRNREKLKAFCEPYGTFPATSVTDAILRDDVDAVYISVTNGEAMLLEAENGMIANTGFHYAEPALVKTGDSIEILQGKKGYTVEFDNVADEIRQGRTGSAFIPPRMTLDCMRILDECRRQMGLVYPFE